MSELNHIVQKLLHHELSLASSFVNRATIDFRVLRRVADILGITMEDIYATKNQIYVHISVSETIERLWKKGKLRSSSATQSAKAEFESAVERFLSKDYLNCLDVAKFCRLMQKVNDEALKHLWVVFAVDGLHGFNFESYKENLKFPLKFGEAEMEDDEESPQETHIRAVRSMYQFIEGIKPKNLSRVLKRIFESESTESEMLPLYNQVILSEESDSDCEEGKITLLDNCMEKEYKRYVSKKLKNIHQWIKEEEEILNQKNIKKHLKKRKIKDEMELE